MVKKKTFGKSFIKTYEVWEDLLDKVTLGKELPNQEIKLVEVVKLSDMQKEIDDNYVLKSHLKLSFIPRKELKEEKNKTNEIIFDMLNQCCGNEESTEIDNRCMSCYEDACDYLTKEGWLKEINSRMYKVIKKIGD